MMGSTGPALLWFRRDLRLHDHPGLAAALLAHERVVPVFIVDTRLVGGRFASPIRTSFMLESVRSLAAGIASRGSTLVVRIGDPREIVPALVAELGAAAVHVSRDHAPYGRGRDRAVEAALRSVGVPFHEWAGNLVHEPEDVRTADEGPFSVYSPFRRAWERRPRRPIVAAPQALPTHDLEPGTIPTLADLDLEDASVRSVGPYADRLPEAGEPAGRLRMVRWLDRGVDEYAGTRDRLDLEDGSSRLSQDLHFGLVSPLELVERAAASGGGDGRRTFVNELVWREFYAHVLFHRPDLRERSFRAAFDDLDWAVDPAAIEAWREGRTGYPVVDAAMRQLLVAGWMPNRARMIAASFLSKHLLTDWRVGEAHFMRHLVDGDVASNNGGWQWSASTGTDPQPYFRIFNPMIQGRRFDPDGTYVRRWVPELGGLATERIHAPWEASDAEQEAAGCRIGVDYPAPIVEHAMARARALAAYDAARRTS